MLAYGGLVDHLDEYIRMGESIILECVNKFTKTMVQEYGDVYLRELNIENIARLLDVAEHRGFPGMLGSIYCMCWEWEKCPTALHGQFRGHHKKPTIMIDGFGMHSLELRVLAMT
jgi:hypothetical protein